MFAVVGNEGSKEVLWMVLVVAMQSTNGHFLLSPFFLFLPNDGNDT